MTEQIVYKGLEGITAAAHKHRRSGRAEWMPDPARL